jgi:probable F420-dependent oxidoreductase
VNLKFGTTIMGARLRELPDTAHAAERCGFESAWMPEHLVFPAEVPPTYPYSETGDPPFQPRTPVYDVWVLFAYLTQATETIRFATNVYVLPLRHPLQTARSVVTLDRLSGGRVTLGVGIGWLKEEFDYLGLNFADRGRRTDDAIRVIRRLWTEDAIEVDDDHFRFGPVAFEPKPRALIPIEVGGVTRPALRRAALLGDGWVEWGCPTIEDFQTMVEYLEQQRAEAGASGPFEITVCGDLARDTRNFARLAAVGATRIVVDPRWTLGPRLTVPQMTDWAERFQDEVISRHG